MPSLPILLVSPEATGIDHSVKKQAESMEARCSEADVAPF
jgi:hypothetical protein